MSHGKSAKAVKRPRSEAAAPDKVHTVPVGAAAKTAATPSASAPCKSAMLVLGNYHSVMAGLVLKREKFYLKFAIKHHVGSVSAVAVTERYVASCGADERVFLFTNKAQQKLTPAVRQRLREAGEPVPLRLADLGSLTPPCEVLCLAFTPGSQYLLCGCAEGQLLVYRTRDWSLSRTLSVHERGLRAFSVHPGSSGTLVVSVGADRSVAVLDLAKGRLLTKWKYDAVSAAAHVDAASGSESLADGEASGKETRDSPAEASTQAAKRSRRERAGPLDALSRLQAREEPIDVVFSPDGSRFLLLARFSLVVYDSTSMAPLAVLRLAQPPQPQEEMHCAAFLSEDTILVGNESAQILSCRLPVSATTPSAHAQAGTSGAALKSAEGPLRLLPVSLTYPPSVRAEAEKLLATPLRVEAEGRLKHPLRHVSRLKALRLCGQTVFSLDSNGIVFAWGAQSARSAGEELTFEYVTSANCQGRTTSLDVLAL